MIPAFVIRDTVSDNESYKPLLTLYMPNYLMQHKKFVHFFFISRHRNVTGSLNIFPWRGFFYTPINTAADDLATEETRT